MKTRAELDRIEAKVGTHRPTEGEIEAALRRMVATEIGPPEPVETYMEAAADAEAIVDKIDVADRDAARSKLYQAAYTSLKDAFKLEARNALVPDKTKSCGDPASRWRHCTRRSRSTLVLPDGSTRGLCFQHEDPAIDTYAVQKLREVFAPDDDGIRSLIERTEHHEAHEAHEVRNYGSQGKMLTTPVTVAEIWRRVAARIERVRQAFPEGPQRIAFDERVARFESKWG